MRRKKDKPRRPPSAGPVSRRDFLRGAGVAVSGSLLAGPAAALAATPPENGGVVIAYGHADEAPSARLRQLPQIFEEQPHDVRIPPRTCDAIVERLLRRAVKARERHGNAAVVDLLRGALGRARDHLEQVRKAQQRRGGRRRFRLPGIQSDGHLASVPCR